MRNSARKHRWLAATAALFALAPTAHADPPAAKPKAVEPATSDPSQPTRAQCLEAHRNAQELKQSAKLVEMQAQLLVCSSGSCPGAIISDCGNWIAELEQTTPSMVFEIRSDGKEALDAQVLVDGQPVADRAHALKVNPGRHKVRVELPPFEPQEQDLVLPEGQRMRLISVEFKSKAAEPAPAAASVAPPPRETERPTPVVVYPLLALGVVGLGSFAAFGSLGSSEQNDLEKSCAPRCTDSDLKKMKRWYTIGDVSAGVGAAALIGAAIVYLARPTKEVDRASTKLSIDVGSIGQGPSAVGSFGLHAVRRW
jgi:hypothetical protein